MNWSERLEELVYSQEQRDAFLERMRVQVGPEDYRHIESLCQLALTLGQDNLSKLQHLLFGRKTETTDRVCPVVEPAPPVAPKPPPKGHGRCGARHYTGARWIQVNHPALHKGQRCPQRQKGSLRTQRRRGVLLRIQGSPPISATAYGTNGMTSRQVDGDGVTLLLRYDNLARLEYTAMDINTNGDIDFAGTDRITRTVTVITNNGAADVQRVSTYAWDTTNLDAATLLSVAETSTDGLRTWNEAYGVTNRSVTTYAGNHRYVTNISADGSRSVSDFSGGRLLSVLRKNGNGLQLGQTTYDYDAHGRLNRTTDARNGTTTNTFDNADRITAVSTPAPGTGASSQVTSRSYDSMGQITSVTQPDGGVVSTSYYLTGEVATNSGARTYPVAYTYDYAGRLKTLTTWTNFSGSQGAAVTTWTYEAQRGWLTNKAYADNQGPGYSYTSAGRLKTRLGPGPEGS